MCGVHHAPPHYGKATSEPHQQTAQIDQRPPAGTGNLPAQDQPLKRSGEQSDQQSQRHPDHDDDQPAGIGADGRHPPAHNPTQHAPGDAFQRPAQTGRWHPPASAELPAQHQPLRRSDQSAEHRRCHAGRRGFDTGRLAGRRHDLEIGLQPGPLHRPEDGPAHGEADEVREHPLQREARLDNTAFGLHPPPSATAMVDRKSTRLNSSHPSISYAVFCLTKKNRACSMSDLVSAFCLCCWRKKWPMSLLWGVITIPMPSVVLATWLWFCKHTATTYSYTLSLHDALPI